MSRFLRNGLTVATLCLGNACAPSFAGLDLSKAPIGMTFEKDGNYIIGPTDVVELRVQGEERMDGAYIVSPSGELSLPLIGFVEAKGLTAPALAKRLQTALQAYIKTASVALAIKEQRSYRVYIGGEVAKVGAYNFTEQTSLLQGITSAGGPGKFAGGNVILLRKDSKGVVRRFVGNYADLVAGNKGLDRLSLERGDVVYFE